MIKKLACAIVAVVVVTLAASPAQAKPVKQRAANAALCYEAITTGSIPLEIAPADYAKCGAIMLKYEAWLKEVYPSQSQSGVFSETEQNAGLNYLGGRVGKAYRVTSTQIVNAYKRLRPNG